MFIPIGFDLFYFFNQFVVFSKQLMSITYLILGSNLGNRLDFLGQAKKDMVDHVGTLIKASAIYESEPWGFVNENRFLNQVLIFTTDLSPEKLLKNIQQTEDKLGRVRTFDRYSSRTIDIDILFYDTVVLNSHLLTIPHPQIPFRNFVLAPLNEVDPDFIHPVLNQNMHSLFASCEDTGKVYQWKAFIETTQDSADL